jgi:hypothetical protein
MMKANPKSKVITVAAQTLRIHPHAQRDLLPHKLKELMNTFDLDAIGVLHGVEYEINGEFAIWIIDGQHRWKVLMDQGLGEWLVEVKIHIDVKDDARASELFLKLNNRAPIHPYDKFENARRAGHTDAVGIHQIAIDRKLKIDRTSRDGNVCCVSVLNSVYNFDDGEALGATLDTVLAAWGHTAAAVEGKLIEGLGLVYRTFNGNVDRPALVKKLAKYPGGPSALIGDARGLREYKHISIPRCVAERVIEVYNTGRRIGRLDPL